MTFPKNKQRILEYAGKYDTKYDDSAVEDEIRAWFRKNRYLNKEIFMKICLWKSQRPKKYYERNQEDAIEEVTRFSLATKNELVRVKSLMTLDGVSFPVASTILHFAFPDQYAIMDFRVIWSLGWEQPQRYTFEFWKRYCNTLVAIAQEIGVSVRTLDKALWTYSKEHQQS